MANLKDKSQSVSELKLYLIYLDWKMDLHKLNKAIFCRYPFLWHYSAKRSSCDFHFQITNRTPFNSNKVAKWFIWMLHIFLKTENVPKYVLVQGNVISNSINMNKLIYYVYASENLIFTLQMYAISSMRIAYTSALCLWWMNEHGTNDEHNLSTIETNVPSIHKLNIQKLKWKYVQHNNRTPYAIQFSENNSF